MTTLEKTYPPPSERYAYIDVLRGIAALMVVYHHVAEVNLNPAFQTHWLEKAIIIFFTQTIEIGAIGVCIFLMISGFVVPFSLFRYQNNPIKNFIGHRVFRLYPAYWLSVPLGLIFVYWRLGVENGGQEINWLMAIINLSMLQDFFGVKSVMGQYWTLTLELLFYAICIALFATKRLSSFKAIVLILISFFILRKIAPSIPNIDKKTLEMIRNLHYLGFMFFGLFYRKWLLENDKKSGKQAAWILVITLLTFGATTNIMNFVRGDTVALQEQVHHIIAISIFFSFTHIHRISNAFGVFLGKISYSIYLFHPVIFYPLFIFWFQSSPLRAHPHLFIAISMLLAIVFSYFTYRFIEMPCIELGRRYFSSNMKKT